ncbi:MAG: peptidylprolyl isomerase [Candidatus Kariarchaeaceae archaeon]|jgi:parvulin-like peptidyl-prolyl isomerase
MSKIKASHILVEKHGKALEVIELLNEGKDFGELAKKYSTDASRKRGGNLGEFGRGKMVKEFENAAFALNKGEYTKQPVKTVYGYHIIMRTK